MGWRRNNSSPSRMKVISCILSIISITHYASALETHIRNEDRAPNSDTVIHHPAASLSIAGDLKDLKLKSSIAQLVRALQTPPVQSKGQHESLIPIVKPPELITKQNFNHLHPSSSSSSQARKLIYGQPEDVPSPITISSQSIRINSNKTGGKGRSRSMVSVESDVIDAAEQGIRTIEGVRVPDDEHDKHHTWRNARVIKGFLVPNDKSPNPHKKRQVVVHTDPQSYLAAAAAAQAQGATTLLGASPSGPLSQQGRQFSQSDLANAAAAYLASQSQSQPHQQRYQTYQNQQPQYHPNQPVHQHQPHQFQQQQYQLPLPSSSAARAQQLHHQQISGQTTAYAYPQQQQATQQQQPGQMYLLQDEGGNTYVQYSPDSNAGSQTQQLQQPSSQFLSHLSHSQSQFSSRSGEPAQAPGSTAQQQQKTETSENNNKSPQEKVAEAQVQAAVQAIQQTIQQKQASEVQGGALVAQASQTVASAQQASQRAQPDIVGTEYIIQQVPGQSAGTTVHQLASPQSRQISNEYGNLLASASSNSFVIQPQTYVTGPGGPTFTIPIPIPSDQVQSQSSVSPSSSSSAWHHAHALQSHNQQHQQKNPYAKSRNNNNNIADKVMDALHTNRKTLEGIDKTTAVVPALASTGIFLGLTALAAGWYLSKGNREVGIVRRTGKPAGGGGHSRFRRDVVAQPVNSYPQEVDQATFFQSIIQQSLEKTQQQYENQAAAGDTIYSHVQQPEPVYNREPEPERNHRPHKNYRNNRPQNRNDDHDFYDKSSKNQIAQEKSGPLTVASSKNFAKVFVPALILGLSVISITALIFFWYITGANREIAFLEPSNHQRKKRSLMGSTALSDGWLQRTITAIHHNPYDRMPAPTSKSLLPHPSFMDRETSKTSDLEFKISNAAITGLVAGGALIAIFALGLANSFSSDTPSRQLKTGRANSNPSSFSVNNNLNSNNLNNANNPLKHLRAPRSLVFPEGYNDLAEAPVDSPPGYMASIMSSIEDAHQSLITSLHDSGLFDSKSPCAKRLVCELLLSEVDNDTLRTTEKRMATFFDVLPDSVAKPWKESMGEIVSSVQKGDCSAFSCGNNSR